MERVPMGEGILGGIRIVEIAGGHALSVTGLLLAEAGAEVIKVEADAGARGSASFAVWNRSKKSVGLAIEGEEARRSRSEEHTSELQSLMRNSYAVFCLKKKMRKRN